MTDAFQAWQLCAGAVIVGIMLAVLGRCVVGGVKRCGPKPDGLLNPRPLPAAPEKPKTILIREGRDKLIEE